MSGELFLLADSQIMFWKDQVGPVMKRFRRPEYTGGNKGVYIGAANGDESQYFDVFCFVMEQIGIDYCRHITADLAPEKVVELAEAEIIVLAGGDVEVGWSVIEKLKQPLWDAHQRGATVVGISAGAVHLGVFGWPSRRRMTHTELIETLGWVPYVVGAHDEGTDWITLQQVVRLSGGAAEGLGIPSGGGVLVTAEGKLKVLRKPLVCFRNQGCELVQTILYPD